MKFKKGDKVIVITGKEKGKSSTIVRVLREENKVVLEGLNMMKKHIKPKKAGDKSTLVPIAMPINASNVKMAEGKAKVEKVAVKKSVKKTIKKGE